MSIEPVGTGWLIECIHRYSHSALEKKIIKYLKEVGDGLHEDSVLDLIASDDEIDKQEHWEQFKRELQELGITAAAQREHRDFIRAIVLRAKADGVVDETNPLYIPGDTDSKVSSMTTLVNKMFDERALDIKQLYDKSEHVESKKPSPLITLGLRALRIVSDERLIEAADENELKHVKDLIRRGANVNASDKWRWTALHMAAYGGYDDIARVLISAGAKLDARTVDGETPLKLAEIHRHRDVVCTITDEVDRLRDELEEHETTPTDNND
jgi:hypothetical protein